MSGQTTPMHKIAPRTTCQRSTTAEALRSYSRIIYESKVSTYLQGFRLRVNNFQKISFVSCPIIGFEWKFYATLLLCRIVTVHVVKFIYFEQAKKSQLYQPHQQFCQRNYSTTQQFFFLPNHCNLAYHTTQGCIHRGDQCNRGCTRGPDPAHHCRGRN